MHSRHVLMYDLLTNEEFKDIHGYVLWYRGRLGYLNWDNQKVEPTENMFFP